MESYAYSYADSGDSGDCAREIDSESGSHHNHHPHEINVNVTDALHLHHPPPPPAAAGPARVKLMISYGGRIQLRPHDNQLSYLNGETKILAVDRSMRFAEFHAKIASVCGTEEVCVKYQLPGEDLDALISVTNDEDLEHMVMEFDRLHFSRSLNNSSSSSRSTARIRVFLFPINPPSPSPALLEPKHDRPWFMAEAINSLPSPMPCNGHVSSSPDYLFGLDNGFVPPPAVKVKDPTPPPPLPEQPASAVEIPVKEDRQIGAEPSPNGSSPEIQRQIQELEKLQVTDNQPPSQSQSLSPPKIHSQTQTQTQQQQGVITPMPRNGSDETLANRGFPQKTQEKPPVPAPAPAMAPVQQIQQPSPQAPPATAVPQPTMTAPSSYIPRFQSIAGGDHQQHPHQQQQQQLYVISHAPPGYFAAAPPGTTSFVYAMPPPAGGGGGGGEYGGGPVAAAAAGYDNAGRTVYYTSMMPAAAYHHHQHHQAVAGVALSNTAAEGPKPVKPSQVS